MGNDIAAVKTLVSNLVNDVSGDINEPSQFVLVTFNDLTSTIPPFFVYISETVEDFQADLAAVGPFNDGSNIECKLKRKSGHVIFVIL